MLYVIATPIGQESDIGVRGAQLLQLCPVIIGEEKKLFFSRLKSFGIKAIQEKEVYFLNEHSQSKDIKELVEICQIKKTALITDCGTPAFCDPGADLIAACHERSIAVRSIPGPSSLTAFLSVCGRRVDEFVFCGFIPQKREKRKTALQVLQKEKRPIILMDTPYRLKSLLDQLDEFLPNRRAILGLCLGSEKEKILYGKPKKIQKELQIEKAEFVLMLEAI